MRGKPGERETSPEARRIIPAHAGQTNRAGILDGIRPDHPRACGANMGGSPEGEAQFGSSPRMRGKRTHARMVSVQSRIIPAHAGQTPRLPSRSTVP